MWKVLQSIPHSTQTTVTSCRESFCCFLPEPVFTLHLLMCPNRCLGGPVLHKLDPKYDVPGRTRLKCLMDQTYDSSKSQVLSALSSARFDCGELSAGNAIDCVSAWNSVCWWSWTDNYCPNKAVENSDNDRLCQTVDICAVGYFCFTGTAKTIDWCSVSVRKTVTV